MLTRHTVVTVTVLGHEWTIPDLVIPADWTDADVADHVSGLIRVEATETSCRGRCDPGSAGPITIRGTAP